MPAGSGLQLKHWWVFISLLAVTQLAVGDGLGSLDAGQVKNYFTQLAHGFLAAGYQGACLLSTMV